MMAEKNLLKRYTSNRMYTEDIVSMWSYKEAIEYNYRK